MKSTLVIFIPILFMAMSFTGFGQTFNRNKMEDTAAFLHRISGGKYIENKVVTTDFNTPGEKIVYFYFRMVEDTALNRQKDSLNTLRMVVLIPGDVKPLDYKAFDLDLDYDKGYGLGIESTELIKNKKEKKLNIAVYHLRPGPGRVRMKVYENFVLKQRSNNGGFFNDFELINLR